MRACASVGLRPKAVTLRNGSRYLVEKLVLRQALQINSSKREPLYMFGSHPTHAPTRSSHTLSRRPAGSRTSDRCDPTHLWSPGGLREAALAAASGASSHGRTGTKSWRVLSFSSSCLSFFRAVSHRPEWTSETVRPHLSKALPQRL